MIYRRLMVLTAGVGAIFMATPVTTTAQAEQTPSEAAAIRANCEHHGGTPRTRGDGNGPQGEWYCDLPDAASRRLEAQCKAQEGPAEILSFDMKTGRCEQDCFLTTACAELIGLDDDCFELRTLRWFRDEKLAHMPNGQRDIAIYYQTAPDILRRIGQGTLATRQLSAIYAAIIAPSVVCIKLRQYELARIIYTRGMQRLLRAYMG